MTAIDKATIHLNGRQYSWLVTGVAGFIGSHILEFLLSHNQKVIGLDNFSTGKLENLDAVKFIVKEKLWENFEFLEGDILDKHICDKATKNIDFVLHQAALGSVPRSIANPLDTHNSNINGFINILDSARQNTIKNFVYASSSSVYGDSHLLPKEESIIGKQLSPYAVTKLTNELYSNVYTHCYGIPTIGLRYFNVFGSRQNPNGEYAAVIPRWLESIKNNSDITIYGDGKTSRDFCYVSNAVQANVLSALSFSTKDIKSKIYNVACFQQTTLLELFNFLKNSFYEHGINYEKDPTFSEFREGDIRHSLADIDSIKHDLGYEPSVNVKNGIHILIKECLSDGNK